MAFRFPIQDILNRGQEASQRRFLAGLQERAAATQEAQIAELVDRIDRLQESQEKIAEDQQKGIDALVEANKLAQEWREEMAQQMTDAAARLDKFMGAAEATSGGVIGQVKEDGTIVNGYPWATGDVIWSTNTTATRPGWIMADARWLFADEYPELFAVLGTRFGVQTAADGRMQFRLPSRTECPGYFEGLRVRWQAFIRL